MLYLAKKYPMCKLLFIPVLFFTTVVNFAQADIESHAKLTALLNSPHTVSDGMLTDAGYMQVYSSLDEENPEGDLIMTYESAHGNEISLMFVSSDQQQSVTFTLHDETQFNTLKKEAIANGYVFVNKEMLEGAERHYYLKGTIELELAIGDGFYTYTLRRK